MHRQDTRGHDRGTSDTHSAVDQHISPHRHISREPFGNQMDSVRRFWHRSVNAGSLDESESALFTDFRFFRESEVARLGGSQHRNQDINPLSPDISKIFNKL